MIPHRLSVALVLIFAALARGESSQFAKQLYSRVTPSLVAVQYTWESEAGRREIVGGGVVVSADGLIMFPIAITDLRIPDEQMKDFKIIIPQANADDVELDAKFVGRDERANVSYVRPVEKHNFTAVKFVPKNAEIGDEVFSIGLLPKAAGYRTYITSGIVSANLRGETPMVLVSSGLTLPGSLIFNSGGDAIGFVNAPMGEFSAFLNGDPRNAMYALSAPPRMYVPARDFLFSIGDPPVAGVPMKLPWTGVSQITGLKKDVADFYGIKDPAVQIGDVIADSPASKAGLKSGDIITAINGTPLERGDEPEELPQIFRRRLLKLKVGSPATFSIVRGKENKQITVALGEQPLRSTLAKRYFAEDLGFSIRDAVFTDLYARKLRNDSHGVVVAFVRPSSSAASAKLQREDLITEFNRKPVESADEFKQAYTAYRKEHPSDAVVLMVLREGNTQVIRIEPPQ